MQSPGPRHPERARTRLPHVLSVVRDPEPDDLDARIDWSSWYLTDEDDMGESPERHEIIATAKGSIEELARERAWPRTLIGADAFFAWMKEEPNVRVSPDIHLLDDPPAPLPKMWQTWLPGHRPPRLAVEIVSTDWRKDYDDAPPKYALLGAAEFVIFDPDAAPDQVERTPLQVYRRQADGGFVRVYRGGGPAHSAELGAWFVARREGLVVRLRISRDAEGLDGVPTTAEAREAAEREIAGLRAEIERLRRG